ncbi:MAG: hypothetical protein K2X35_00410 [Bryobacteraceae bacterium]|nr:hypothetical protein [Bryobacteraceae bacterium]
MSVPRRWWFALGLAGAAAAQVRPRPGEPRSPFPEDDVRLPSGKSQKDEILKAEHAKALEDLKNIKRLAGEIEQELEKNDRFILSLGAIKKSEEIEKLARKLKDRLKMF